MMDFTVYYAYSDQLWTKEYVLERGCELSRRVPVVRLAEVEKLIQEAVLFAENVMRNGRWQEDEWYKAQAFLASPLVAAWRERQEGKP